MACEFAAVEVATGVSTATPRPGVLEARKLAGAGASEDSLDALRDPSTDSRDRRDRASADSRELREARVRPSVDASSVKALVWVGH